MGFNNAQLEVLNCISCIDNDKDLNSLKELLPKFLNELLQNKLDDMWNKGELSQEKIEEWGNSHLRTTYK